MGASHKTSDDKSPGLWIQNIVSPGAADEGKISFRPTTIGVLCASYPIKENVPEIDLRFDPIDGWMGILDTNKKEGMVFLVDYNWLKCLYCSAQALTQEWWYDPVTLPPGKSWQTQVVIWPVFGLDSVAHASPNCVSQVKLLRDGRRVGVNYTLVPGPANQSTSNLKIEMCLIKYPGLEVLDKRVWNADFATNNPSSFEYMVDGVSETESVLLGVSIGGSSPADSFNVFSAGTCILGTEQQHRFPQPKRIREKLMPVDSHIKRNTVTRVLNLRGLFSNSYRWPSVIAKLGGELVEGYYKRGTFGSTIVGFPKSYSEMLSYNVIVLNHVPLDSLSDDSWEMLTDYCKCGGVLLVIGGPMSSIGIDPAIYDDPDILPVKIEDLWRVDRAKSIMPLEKCNSEVGTWQYRISTEHMVGASSILSGTKANPVIIYRRIGSGVTSVFTPLVLSNSIGDSGFWNKAGFTDWMANRVKELLGLVERGNVSNE